MKKITTTIALMLIFCALTALTVFSDTSPVHIVLYPNDSLFYVSSDEPGEEPDITVTGNDSSVTYSKVDSGTDIPYPQGAGSIIISVSRNENVLFEKKINLSILPKIEITAGVETANIRFSTNSVEIPAKIFNGETFKEYTLKGDGQITFPVYGSEPPYLLINLTQNVQIIYNAVSESNSRQLPLITLERQYNGIITQDDHIVINGCAEQTDHIFLNSVEGTLSGSYFSFDCPLCEGENELTLVAKNENESITYSFVVTRASDGNEDKPGQKDPPDEPNNNGYSVKQIIVTTVLGLALAAIFIIYFIKKRRKS